MKLLNNSEYNLMHDDIVLKKGEEKEVKKEIAEKFLKYTGVIEIKAEKKEKK